MGSILVVCTGNICRSPVGEAVLKSLLPGRVTVSSAGTRAMDDRPAEPEAIDFLRREIGAEIDHHATQLTPGLAEAADLILTMTEEQRAWVTQLVPRAVRRTYTVLEYSRVLMELEGGNPRSSLSELVRAGAPLRGRINARGEENNIADPYGGPPEVYAASFGLIAEASREIVTKIAEQLSGAAR